jgi:hypothetical protein
VNPYYFSITGRLQPRPCGPGDRPPRRRLRPANAESALAHADDRYQFGCNWAAPVDVADFVRQTSGLDLVNAALLVS